MSYIYIVKSKYDLLKLNSVQTVIVCVCRLWKGMREIFSIRIFQKVGGTCDQVILAKNNVKSK
jgi:hypothetical protein